MTQVLEQLPLPCVTFEHGCVNIQGIIYARADHMKPGAEVRAEVEGISTQTSV